jgi:RNA polymerase sigma factor (sigma-70 family)
VGELSDGEIYARHAQDLVRLATGMVGPHDAADVVSSALSRLLGSSAWRKARDQRAYLYRSVVNEALMFRRSQQRRRVREARAALAERVDGNADIEALDCLAVLSTRQRAVIVLTYWQDLDQATVSALLGISRGSVARHLARAHARLREVMDDVRQA